MLKDLRAEDANAAFKDCCSSIQPCSQDIAKIAEGIEELCKQKPAQYVGKVADMEEALTNKCHEIKRQKGIVKGLLSQNIKSLAESGTQVELSYKSFG